MSDPVSIGRAIIADNQQNNHYTAHPIFLVQQRRRFYGLDPNYCDNIVWLHEDEAVEVPADLAAQLERGYNGGEPDGYRRTAYVDTWEFVQCFFTRQAAEDYINRQRHNMKDPRVYVDSGHRNPEWQTLRAHLALLATGKTDPSQSIT